MDKSMPYSCRFSPKTTDRFLQVFTADNVLLPRAMTRFVGDPTRIGRCFPAGVHETSSSGYLPAVEKAIKKKQNGRLLLSNCGFKPISCCLSYARLDNWAQAVCSTVRAVLWSHSRAGGRTHSRHFFWEGPTFFRRN